MVIIVIKINFKFFKRKYYELCSQICQSQAQLYLLVLHSNMITKYVLQTSLQSYLKLPQIIKPKNSPLTPYCSGSEKVELNVKHPQALWTFVQLLWIIWQK